MPHPAPAPPEAAALHRLVRALAACANLPAALQALLLALAAALFGRPRRPARTPLRDWYAGTSHPQTDDAPASRAANRLRAWIGWILPGQPARGMRASGARPAAPTPTRTARAPPRAA